MTENDAEVERRPVSNRTEIESFYECEEEKKKNEMLEGRLKAQVWAWMEAR
jgi:hypothetical protein